MKRPFASQLVRNRFRSKRDVRRLIDQHEKEKSSSPLPTFLSGVYHGIFYRVKIPPRNSILPEIPKLPSSLNNTTPRLFKQIDHHTASTSTLFQDSKRRFLEWLNENWSVLVFNVGSICTLVGFTRSDVLELRIFSATGSLSGVLYNLVQKPLRWPPVLWGMTFAGVNAYKIGQIVRERKGTVHLTAAQEDIYVEHFLPHGVTPKQFEVVNQSATFQTLKKGEILVRQGEKQGFVYLVVSGSTQASILGRHLTAASLSPKQANERKGGASGAWIGEMAFLEMYWRKEQGLKEAEEEETKDKSNVQQAQLSPKQEEEEPATKPLRRLDSKTTVPVKPRTDIRAAAAKTSVALYTIVAQEDCLIMSWTHEDMEELMHRSPDLRNSLTRAMAAAIVGKVVNFTVSRANASSWSRWLGDWRQTEAHVQVQDTEEEEHDPGLAEDLPQYPVKKFG